MKLSEENALNTFLMHIVHNYIDTFPVRNVFPLDLEFLCALFANDSLPDIKKNKTLLQINSTLLSRMSCLTKKVYNLSGSNMYI